MQGSRELQLGWAACWSLLQWAPHTLIRHGTWPTDCGGSLREPQAPEEEAGANRDFSATEGLVAIDSLALSWQFNSRTCSMTKTGADGQDCQDGASESALSRPVPPPRRRHRRRPDHEGS